MEGLKRKRHDEILARWFNVRIPGNPEFGKRDYDTSHIRSLDIGYRDWRHSRYEHGAGDELRSYGSHFPLVQAIRERPKNGRMGRVRLWLLNGDTWGGASGFGVSTSSQQSDVRRKAEASGIPTIILPFSAIDAARIDHASIRILAIDEDTWFEQEFRTTEFPEDGEWVPRHEIIPETGYGRRNGNYGCVEFPTWESIPESIRAYFDSDGRVLPIYEEPKEYGQAFGRTYRKYDSHASRDYATGNIEFPKGHPNHTGWSSRDYFYVPPVYRYVGKRLTGRHGEYTLNSDGSYSQTRSVHQLGQSVFRAAYTGANGKRYWANFLSGVDNTPTGSGYFLVQLPKAADVSSVASAIESLKPESVKAAEAMGIDVKRQGDLFAIPTEFNVRKLRSMGAEFRYSRMASAERRAAIRQRWEDRFSLALMELGIPEYYRGRTPVQERNFKAMRQHYQTMCVREEREFDSTVGIHLRRELYGTRHIGTDIAILPNGVTLARGTIRHTGGDHSMLRLGKAWHIVARNTVPLAR